MGRPTIHGRRDENHVRAILFHHGHEESKTGGLELEGAALTFRQSGGEIRSVSSAGMTIIVQDLRPVAMLDLRAILNIDPVCFECHLNRDASFEAFDGTVLVFDCLTQRRCSMGVLRI